MKILVVGGGLAGISLMQTLRERNVEVVLMDSSEIPSSSSVATGMFNPIVFRRINRSWMIEELEPVFHPFYLSLSEELGIELIQPIQLFKKIPSQDYEHLWNQRSSEEEYTRYLRAAKDGFGPVQHAGMVDCALLVRNYRDQLKAKGLYLEEPFEEAHFAHEGNVLIYKDQQYDHIILATGASAAHSPLFGWLPFNICKGEWIEVKSEKDLTQGRVINNIVNIIPKGEGIYKLSSTYSWKELNWESTADAENELLEKFTELYDVPYEIIQRAAGLRPTVADRRPYLGAHPEIKGLHIFNGLGSKGVMLAPFFAQHLADHILDGKSLLPEVNIQRHIKRYKASVAN